jgi:hypothetical protein
MSGELTLPTAARRSTGWIGLTGIVLFYAALYAANYWLPLDHTDYTSRIWNWSQAALTVGALVTLFLHRRSLTKHAALLGLSLAILSSLSHWLHDPSLSWSLQEGLAVWACFLAGSSLFKETAVSVPAFQPPLARIGRSMIFGIAVAIPLALLNNLYFFMSAGSFQIQNVFSSAFAALSPAIHEEIVFRFFVLAMVLRLLHSSASPRLAMFIAVFLAVVPHSLNHLPDLFLANPAMGLFMLTATSLLFGLPMAILQVRKNLETAIAFHWFIDFVRFLFGF